MEDAVTPSGEEAAPAIDPAEDLQIAWENLDLARSIVSRLAGAEDEGPAPAPGQRTGLLLDLVQIHARLGDLQRANAAVLPCIDDYQAALDLRRDLLGPFDRRTADSHFSLAGVLPRPPAGRGTARAGSTGSSAAWAATATRPGGPG